MKVFLSHPMSGLSESEVMNIRNEAVKLLTEKYGEIKIIDNYHHNNVVPENAGRLWHLGTSIRQMEEADAIYFCNNHKNYLMFLYNYRSMVYFFHNSVL